MFFCKLWETLRTYFFVEHHRWLLINVYTHANNSPSLMFERFICTIRPSRFAYVIKWSLSLHSFFIRTSKFCLKPAVLNFFFIFETEMFLICSYFADWTLQCHREECQTEYNKNTLFHFFHFFLSSSVHRQTLGDVLQKSRSATVLKPIKNYQQQSSIFH